MSSLTTLRHLPSLSVSILDKANGNERAARYEVLPPDEAGVTLNSLPPEENQVLRLHWAEGGLSCMTVFCESALLKAQFEERSNSFEVEDFEGDTHHLRFLDDAGNTPVELLKGLA